MFYKYNNEMIKYSIYMNDSDSSFGQKEIDELSEEYEIDNNGVKIKVEAYDISDSKNKRYIAEYTYRNVHYQLKGVMEKSEFDKVLKNLIFL